MLSATELGVMKCDYNPSGQEVAGGSKVQGHPQLRVESKAIRNIL